jgi:dihydrofolate reductase
MIWHTTMSLDGFIAGPDDAMDWAFAYDDRSPWVDDMIAGTGAILAGRNWYDAAVAKYDGRQGIYGGAWDGPVVVVTHEPPVGNEDPGITFATGGLRAAAEAAREMAAGKRVGIFGADTARQCLEAGFVDEIILHVAPVLLGDGVRFYAGERVRLERTDLRASGQLTDLRFRVLPRG